MLAVAADGIVAAGIDSIDGRDVRAEHEGLSHVASFRILRREREASNDADDWIASEK